MNNKFLKQAKDFVLDNPSIAMMLILLVIGTIVSPTFLTGSNMLSVFRRIATNGIMAAGFTIVLMVGGFDLSIAGTLSLCSCLVIGIERSTGSSLLGVVVALLVGLLIGAMNGSLMVLTRGTGGEAFLITMGTQLLAKAIAMMYTSGYVWTGVNSGWYRFIGQGSIAGFLPFATALWIVIMIVLQFMLKKTKFGQELAMVGSNKNASYLVGINVGSKKIAAYMCSGLCAAITAIVLTSRLSSCGPTFGDGSDFDAAVAAVVGGNSLIGGRGGMMQVFIGTFIFGVTTNILNLMTVPSDIQYVVKGLVLLLAIYLDSLKWKRKRL